MKFHGLALLTGLLAASVSAAPVKQARSSSKGRGFAFNDASAIASFATSGTFSWAYNWAASAGGLLPGIEFVPMLWGEKSAGDWSKVVETAIAAGSKHLLSFNEPDLPQQANIQPQKAASLYQQLMNPHAGKAALGAPAVTNGNSANYGLNWLKSFFDACAGKCKVDFLTIHWYDSATNVESFKKHVTDSISFGKQRGINKVWVTEFQGTGDDNAQASFLKQVLPWLDQNEGVERYAYFRADDLVKNGQLSPVGQAYGSG